MRSIFTPVPFRRRRRFISASKTPAAASGPVNLKTWNGLAKASVKTMDGLVLASVKTWNGLT